MHRICGTLASNGYKVTLVGRLRKNSSGLVEKQYAQKRLRCVFEKGKLFYLEYNLRLLFFLLFKKFDVICAIDLDTIIPAYVRMRLRGGKLGYDAHEYFSEVPEVVDRKLVKKVWERVASFTIPKTHFRYTVSTTLANAFEKRYGKPFGVIRNVPKTLGRSVVPHPLQNEPYILYQGALNEGRGLEVLIQSMVELSLKLVIAGEGDLSKELRSLATKLDVNHKIHFLGFYTDDEIEPYTKNAFLGYCLLENRGLSYYYSLANKFFDYTMSGIPALIPEFPEYLQLQKEFEVGCSCKLEVHSIVKAVTELQDDLPKWNALSENALKAAQYLNWDIEGQKLLDIYKRVE